MISLPLMPNEPYTARSFMEKIGATTVIKLDADTQNFIGFTANSTGNGFSIEGGMGYIVNVTAPKTVGFTGSAWQKHSTGSGGSDAAINSKDVGICPTRAA